MKVTVEPDPAPRNTPWHRQIIKVRPIPSTKTGKVVALECGHVVQTFGRIELAEGRLLCTQCRENS